MGGAGRKTAPPVGQPSAPRRRLDSRGRRSAATLSCAARRSWNRDVTSYGCGTRDAQCFRKYRSHSLACGSHDCVVVLPRSTNRAPVVYRAHPQLYTLCCHLPGGRRRRPKRRGAPPQAADSRCAKLNAIFGSAVLPLTSKSGTNRETYESRAPHENHRGGEGRADSAPPGAPQAPQAVRSAATGGGQQVREIKRHFRFRGFGTVYQLCGTNRLALGLSPALRLSLHSESVRRREGSRSGLRTPLCADKRYGAE